MLNPEAVSYWIKQGQAPAHWRIVRGSASLAVRSLLLTFIAAQLAGLGFGTAMNLIIDSYTHAHLDLSSLFFYILIILMSAAIGSSLRASTAIGSIMVFLPEGCLQFTDMNTSMSHTNKVVWFATVADIQLRLNFWTGSHLLIRFYDGSTLKWRPDPCFGPRGKTLQEILAAYTRYQMLNPPRAEHSGYTHYNYPQSGYGMRMY